MQNLLKTILLFSLGTMSATALGHARFKPNSATPPRNDSTGLKTGPCGMVPRTTTPKVYKPGEEILVEWEETINHPGYFIISFSKENDAGFESNVLVPKYVDVLNNPIMTPADYHSYSLKVKLPNVTCTNCTLQLIQYMEDAPDRPYFSCSDIQLVDPNAPVPAPTPMPVPTTPNPTTPTPNGPTPAPTVPTPTPMPMPGTATPAPVPAPGPKPLKPAKPQGLQIQVQTQNQK